MGLEELSRRVKVGVGGVGGLARPWAYKGWWLEMLGFRLEVGLRGGWWIG